MPIYEYYSADTHKIYSFYARRVLGVERVPHCPDGEEKLMVRLLSPFAITGGAQETVTEEGDAGSACDPQQDAEMMRLAGEMSGMDEANPDPRQLGRLMRQMMGVTGEKMPEAMAEMLARMEQGEDPEKLEEEYGDALDVETMEDGGDGTKENRGVRRRRLPPRRDPALYEMSDYL